MRDLLACLLLPWIEHLASLPVPSWRARFVFQVRTVPSVAEALAGLTTANPVVEDLVRRLQAALSDLPPRVVRGRFEILGPMTLGICAGHEARVHEGPAGLDRGRLLPDRRVRGHALRTRHAPRRLPHGPQHTVPPVTGCVRPTTSTAQLMPARPASSLTSSSCVRIVVRSCVRC
ncbi:hypothetical protein NKG05_26375 [Oerskovia sp. M15]